MAKEQVDIEWLFEQYSTSVFRYLLYHIPDRGEAEDLFVEVFAAATTALSRFRGESGHYAWLLGIARQKIAEANRRWARRPKTVLDTELGDGEQEVLGRMFSVNTGECPEEVVLNAEARQVMRACLARLPEAQREALMLQAEGGLSIAEIAQILGRSIAATNSLLQRARDAVFRHGRDYFLE